MKKAVSSVVSIESGRKAGTDPTLPPASAQRKTGKRFVLNAHTRRQFLALVFGPMGYSMKQALDAANHDQSDGWEQVVNMGRREWERRVKGIAA